MIQLISDSSTLLNIEEGKKLGVEILPLIVTVDQKSYHEFEEITSADLIKHIEQGHLPTSSQPAIGAKIAAYEKYPDCDVVDIAMCDGLSGTYQSACSAKHSAVNSDHIHVVNSKTLCTPHNYLIKKALKLIEEGVSVEELLKQLNESIESSISFLIPNDFSFLKRGGRLTPLAATVGGLLRIVPVMTQTEDHMRLEKFAVKRTYKSAVEDIVKFFIEHGVNEGWHFGVSHANNLQRAEEAVKALKNTFNCEVDLVELSPAFITQGGPGCVAIQVIKK